MHNWLNRLERRLYKYNIPPIMRYIVFAMGGVFLLDLFLGMTTAYTARVSLISYLTLMQASSLTSVTLVFLTALLTGIGVFDVIAKYAGAGTVVPITGFANAMVSPAMEFRPEGWVLGTGARLFTIAGPVLVYGVSASIIVGIVYYFIYL